MSREPVICPKCGARMNCHAEMPCDPRTREEAVRAAAGAGVMLEQAYRCPHCGFELARRTT